MKGQWIGEYTGTNQGGILIDIDEVNGRFEGVAFLTDSNEEMPHFRVSIKSKDQSQKFSLRLNQSEFCPVNPRTGDILSSEFLRENFKDVIFPNSAVLHVEWDDIGLNLMWETDIGTSGICFLKKIDASLPSKLKPKRVTWDNYKKEVSKLPRRKYIFRGQNMSWRLRTGFHRTGRVNLYRFLNEDIPSLHRHLSARTTHFFNLQDPEQNGAFFNLVQHYGYPTPLLDWTHSPFVGAFFAFRGLSGKVAKAAPKSKCVRILLFDREAWQSDLQSMNHLCIAFPHFSVREFVAINNERMIPQQGISSYTNIDDIEAYIRFCEHRKGKEYLRAFELPWSERDLVMADLCMMGITAGSLFPGLDGACEEIKERMF